MPIDWSPRPRLSATVHACRAVVAARVRAPDGCAALLRRLRVLSFAGHLLDEPATIERAARESGLDAEALRAWMEEPEVEAALRADMRAARSPSPASRAQDYKLGGPAEERRYTCPSYELERIDPPPADWPTAGRVDLPGYRPIEAYEAALANLAPELRRRDGPGRRRGGARVGGHAARDRGGRGGVRSRPPRRPHGARAGGRVRAGRRRRLLVARMTGRGKLRRPRARRVVADRPSAGGAPEPEGTGRRRGGR